MNENYEQQLKGVNDKVDCLKNDLNQLKDKLYPVIEVWSSLTGLVKVLGWVGRVAKWVGIVGGAVIAMVTLASYKKTGG